MSSSPHIREGPHGPLWAEQACQLNITKWGEVERGELFVKLSNIIFSFFSIYLLVQQTQELFLLIFYLIYGSWQTITCTSARPIQVLSCSQNVENMSEPWLCWSLTFGLAPPCGWHFWFWLRLNALGYPLTFLRFFTVTIRKCSFRRSIINTANEQYKH